MSYKTTKIRSNLLIFATLSNGMDKKLLLNIGFKIKKIRMGKNLSQQELAGLCDFEKATMSRIESGQANPTVRTLHKISRALEVDIAELVQE